MADSEPKTSKNYNSALPHPYFDPEEYSLNWSHWIEDGHGRVFDAIMDGTKWNGDNELTINPQAPDRYNQLAFEVTNRDRMAKTRNRLPLPTWRMGDGQRVWLGYVLERAAKPRPEDYTGAKGCPVNLWLQIQCDMSHEADGYGLTPLSTILLPDEDVHQCVWSGRDWTLQRLKQWQKAHRMGRHMWTPEAQSNGGKIKSDPKDAVLEANARLRALNARVRDLRAYAMAQLGWTHDQMAEALGLSAIAKKLKRVREVVPQLSADEITEALMHAEVERMSIYPWSRDIMAEVSETLNWEEV